MQLSVWNKAVFGKLLWKIISNVDCLWTQWAKNAYLKDDSIWTTKPTDDQPWAWRKLLKLREVFKEHTRVIIGNGKTALLFLDNWRGTGTIADLIGHGVNSWGNT